MRSEARPGRVTPHTAKHRHPGPGATGVRFGRGQGGKFHSDQDLRKGAGVVTELESRLATGEMAPDRGRHRD